MRYEVYKIANVDSIKDTDLLNKFWAILLDAGIRLSGQEILLYTVDTRGEVNIFVNPNPISVRECVLDLKGPKEEHKTATVSDVEYEVDTPAYIEVYISEYMRMIKCTDKLSDAEINSLSLHPERNNYAQIRKNRKVRLPFELRKVDDLDDEKLKEKCRVAMNGHTGEDETLYILVNVDHEFVARINEMICLDNIEA